MVAPPQPPDAARLPAWLRPEHQRLNASLALGMVASLASRGAIRDEADARRDALGATAWPARFEQLDGVGRLRGRTVMG